MEKSRAAYVGPPPPRNYAFKKKEDNPRYRPEENRKRDVYRPAGSERPNINYRPFTNYQNTYRPSGSHQGNWRPNYNPPHSSQSYNNTPHSSQSYSNPPHSSYSQSNYSRPFGGYSNNWRPRGSFSHRPRPLWRPRPERPIENSNRNLKRAESPQKSWKKAKIVIKERETSDEESVDSREDANENSAQNFENIDESGHTFSNDDSHQIQDQDESGQIDSKNEESGEIDENLDSTEDIKVSPNSRNELGEQYENVPDEQDSDYDQDYIEEQIDKIDNEIARLETQLASIRAKKDTEEMDLSKEDFGKNSWEDLDRPPLNEEEIVEKVYNENRKIILSNDLIYSSVISDIPVVMENSISNTNDHNVPMVVNTVDSLLQADLENHSKLHPLISSHIAAQKRTHLIRLTSLALEYKERDLIWKRKIESSVKKYDKRKSEPVYPPADHLPSPTIPTAPSPVTPGSQTTSSRNRRSGFRSDYVKSESELASALIALGVDPAEVEFDAPKYVAQDDPSRLAIDPPMILDPVEKSIILSFKSTNGLVKDPAKSLEDFNSSLEYHWHKEEKDIFKTKLIQYGKNFRKIASFLPLKSTSDCVQYFYREKINLGFKQAIRRGVNAGQRGRKRGKSRQDQDSGTSSFRICKLHPDEQLPRQRQGLLQYVSWDPTEQGKEEETFSEEVEDFSTPWTSEEQMIAIKALEDEGKDYSTVSQILGNKSEEQIRSFYSTHKRKQKRMKLEEMKQIMKEIKDPGVRKSDNDVQHDGFEWEYFSKRRGKKRTGKRKEDEYSKKKLKNKDAEGMSNSMLGSMDDFSRRTISYWSVSEKAQFISSLRIHGRKWELIAKDVGTKSAIQVRNFFSNSRAKLNLDDILAGAEGQAVNEEHLMDLNAVKPSESAPKSGINVLLNEPDPVSNVDDPPNDDDVEWSIEQRHSSDRSYPRIDGSPVSVISLPPPGPISDAFPKTLSIDLAVNEPSKLPPMRNFIPNSNSEINKGLGITKIEDHDTKINVSNSNSEINKGLGITKIEEDHDTKKTETHHYGELVTSEQYQNETNESKPEFGDVSDLSEVHVMHIMDGQSKGHSMKLDSAENDSTMDYLASVEVAQNFGETPEDELLEEKDGPNLKSKVASDSVELAQNVGLTVKDPSLENSVNADIDSPMPLDSLESAQNVSMIVEDQFLENEVQADIQSEIVSDAVDLAQDVGGANEDQSIEDKEVEDNRKSNSHSNSAETSQNSSRKDDGDHLT